jgi:hypothetical protein
VKEFIGGPGPKWARRAEAATQVDLEFLGYEYELHDAAAARLRLAALAAVQNPLIKTTINISFALRRVLRRYLGIGGKVLNHTGYAT